MKNYIVMCQNGCGEVSRARLKDPESLLLSFIIERHGQRNPGHTCTIVDADTPAE